MQILEHDDQRTWRCAKETRSSFQAERQCEVNSIANVVRRAAGELDRVAADQAVEQGALLEQQCASLRVERRGEHVEHLAAAVFAVMAARGSREDLLEQGSPQAVRHSRRWLHAQHLKLVTHLDAETREELGYESRLSDAGGASHGQHRWSRSRTRCAKCIA